MHKTDALVFIVNCPPSQERVAMCHPLPDRDAAEARPNPRATVELATQPLDAVGLGSECPDLGGVGRQICSALPIG